MLQGSCRCIHLASMMWLLSFASTIGCSSASANHCLEFTPEALRDIERWYRGELDASDLSLTCILAQVGAGISEAAGMLGGAYAGGQLGGFLGSSLGNLIGKFYGDEKW